MRRAVRRMLTLEFRALEHEAGAEQQRRRVVRDLRAGGGHQFRPLEEPAEPVESGDAPQAQPQLDPVEWFREEVVGSGAERREPGAPIVEGGQHEHGHVRKDGRLAEPLADIEAREAREHDIQQDDVGLLPLRHLETLEAGRRGQQRVGL